MTSTESSTAPIAPPFSAAGTLLEGLAARDFELMTSALHPDVHLRALLPSGYHEWDGVDGARSALAGWFGDADRFELVDASVGEVGPRLHLRWRVRVQWERLGPGWFVAEQQVYADADEDRAIGHLSLLCSGYNPEAPGD